MDIWLQARLYGTVNASAATSIQLRRNPNASLTSRTQVQQ
ncbi:hypothetical protein HCH_03241 [Hahella chejuensis KCTC 2396]|uniref:Uncharacterized protein n=1 Tax=Hahella chejuensis (strain KCTC 2396) TaxID=349521 RepID=Q2SH73_HAHCH|nr:hypothetical protein HCH_03241 [Hahella chejuensis KCTC 2396]